MIERSSFLFLVEKTSFQIDIWVDYTIIWEKQNMGTKYPHHYWVWVSSRWWSTHDVRVAYILTHLTLSLMGSLRKRQSRTRTLSCPFLMLYEGLKEKNVCPEFLVTFHHCPRPFLPFRAWRSCLWRWLQWMTSLSIWVPFWSQSVLFLLLLSALREEGETDSRFWMAFFSRSSLPYMLQTEILVSLFPHIIFLWAFPRRLSRSLALWSLIFSLLSVLLSFSSTCTETQKDTERTGWYQSSGSCPSIPFFTLQGHEERTK